MDKVALIAALPLTLAILSMVIKDVKVTRRLIALLIWLQLGVVLWLVMPVLQGVAPELRLSSEFSLDRISSLFLLLTTLVVACSLSHANFFFAREAEENDTVQAAHVKMVYACSCLFLLAMSSVFACDNLGFLWISVEATTLMSAPLVYFNRSKHALEATWKYLIICSVGIAFALLGTVFIFAASQHDGTAAGSLNISQLIADGPRLHLPLLRLGFIFCFLGYGTKAGMFPIHSWLPDAHSEAPAPASAMLSGSLLNCALFGIWRISQILSASQQAVITNQLTLWVGALTVVAASVFLIRQHGFKRLWAYSSIENVGLMLVAIGLGSGALFFWQALNHSLAKVSLFLLSGNVVQAAKTHHLPELRGMVRVSPVWSLLLALSAFAVTGAPPFGAFVSEWLILTRVVDMNHWLIAVALLCGLALAFVAVSIHLGRVLVGKPRADVAAFSPLATSLVPAVLVACSLLLGFVTNTDFLVISR